MDKPKKEPALLHHKPEIRLCLNCGFPNRDSDKNCMYCRTSVVEDAGLISWMRQTYYILRWRWQLKQRRENVCTASKGHLSFLNLFGFFIVGAILSSVGLYWFSSAVAENSFSSGLIAILFLSYGIITLRSLFIKK